MTKRLPINLAALALLATAALNCSAPPSTDGDADTATGSEEGDEASIGTRADAIGLALPARCYGKMLKTAPFDFEEQPIGLPMTVRINRACDRGAPLVARKLRVYIRRYELGSAAGPQQLLADWTNVPGIEFRRDIPWTAGRLADGTTLPPGRYQIYSYSLNASLYDAWLQNDSFARNMSTRSDNTYIELRAPGAWETGDWGSCSSACGGGTQTRSSACQDGHGGTLPSRMCLASEPVSMQSCNMAPCPPSPEEVCADGGGQWDAGSQTCMEESDICQSQGGYWDGAYCDYGQQGPSAIDMCIMDGGHWNGSSCDYMNFPTPMEDCMMSGGMWMGNYCEYGP